MKTRATSLPACNCPNTASLQRTDEVVKQAEEILKNTPGVKYYTSVVGYSMLSGVNNTYSGFFFITLRGVGQTQEARGEIPGHHGAPEPGVRQHPRRARLRLSAARHSRRGHLGRRDVHPGGPLGQGTTTSWPRT